MSTLEASTGTTRTLRFHEYGEPADVLRLETAPIPEPEAGRIRIAVHACGLAPVDWGICRGRGALTPPRGIGFECSGIVEGLGEGVTDVAIGDRVFGMVDWANQHLAGASDHAILDYWCTVPDGLDLTQAAALPLALSTADWHLERLGIEKDRTVLIHGAGTTIGYAAVQIALVRGMRVIATAGDTYAQRLRDLGATVTGYGDGMVERVTSLNGGPVDIVLDTAPISGVLPDLVQIAGGDPRHVMTVTDFAAAKELGVRSAADEDLAAFLTSSERFRAFPEFAQLAAEGKFTVPIAGTFPLEDWRTPLEISLTGKARGKLLLLADGTDADR